MSRLSNALVLGALALPGCAEKEPSHELSPEFLRMEPIRALTQARINCELDQNIHSAWTPKEDDPASAQYSMNIEKVGAEAWICLERQEQGIADIAIPGCDVSVISAYDAATQLAHINLVVDCSQRVAVDP